MRKLIILLFLVTAHLYLSGSAWAEEGQLYISTHGGAAQCDDFTQEQHLYLMNSEALGLNEKQVKKLRNIKIDCEKDCIIDRERLRVSKVKMDEILEEDDIDMRFVEKRSREISEIMNRLRIRRIKGKVEAMMILTPEQKEKAKELIK